MVEDQLGKFLGICNELLQLLHWKVHEGGVGGSKAGPGPRCKEKMFVLGHWDTHNVMSLGKGLFNLLSLLMD